jgi:hypothetical protein
LLRYSPLIRFIKDTIVEVVDEDSIKYQVPLSIALTYDYSKSKFGVGIISGIVKKEKTISNVVTLPPTIIKPTLIEKAQYALIGGGVVATIALVLILTN